MAVEERLQEILQSIQRSNTQNTETFEKLSRHFDEVAELAAKKPRIDRTALEFKSKGNEDQFVFNEGLEDRLIDSSKHLKKLTEAIPAALPDPLEASTGAMTKAKKSLDEGMALIAHRQKLIKLADRSEHGWKVVKEYESDVLAENEDDEKRIAKAEKAAEKRAAVTAAKKKKVSPKSQTANFSTRPAYQQQQFQAGKHWWPRGGRPPAVFSSPKAPVLNPRPIGPCFRCGEMGHLQNSCPRMSSQYPQSSVLHVDESTGCGEHPIECSELFVRYWEFMEVGGTDTNIVKGSLRQHSDFWHKVLSATPFVLDIIENGYKLPLMSIPPVIVPPIILPHAFIMYLSAQQFKSLCVMVVLSK